MVNCYLCDEVVDINDENVTHLCDSIYICLECYNNEYNYSENCCSCFIPYTFSENIFYIKYLKDNYNCIKCLLNIEDNIKYEINDDLYISYSSDIHKENKGVQTKIGAAYFDIKVDKKRKYFPRRLSQNETKIIEVNAWYKWIDFSKYTIGTTIIAAKKGWESKVIIIGNFCKNCREPTNTSDDYCTPCYKDMSGQSGRPGMGSYSGIYNKCDNCCNLFKFNKKSDIYCYKCILDYCPNCFILEEKLEEYKKINNGTNNIRKSRTNKILTLINKIKNGDFYGKKEFKIGSKTYVFNGKYSDKKEKYSFLKYFNNNFWNEKYQYDLIKDNIEDPDEYYLRKTEEYKKYWEKVEADKIKSKNKMNEIFRDYSVIKLDKEYFINKYENKTLKEIYMNIHKELNDLEEEYNNFRKIEEIYLKLRQKNTDVLSKIKEIENNEINNLISEYEKLKLNEYTVLKNIGKKINNGLSKNDAKKISLISNNDRSSRLIRYCKRLYLLEKHYDIKTIFNAGITNYIRDFTDNSFNIFLNFCVKNNV